MNNIIISTDFEKKVQNKPSGNLICKRYSEFILDLVVLMENAWYVTRPQKLNRFPAQIEYSPLSPCSAPQ